MLTSILKRCLLVPLIWFLNPLAFIENICFRYFDKKTMVGELGVFAYVRDVALSLSNDVITFFEVKYKQNPNTLKPIFCYLLGQPVIILRNPQHITSLYNQIPITDIENLRAYPQILERFSFALGYNIVTADIHEWSYIRKRTLKFLIGSHLNNYENAMLDVTEKVLLPSCKIAAQNNSDVDIWNLMLQVSSRIIFRTFVGLTDDQIPNDVHILLNDVFDVVRIVTLYVLPPKYIPSKTIKECEAKKDKVRNLLKAYFDTRKNSASLFGSIIRSHTCRRDIPYEDLKTFLIMKGISEPNDKVKEYYQGHSRDDIYDLASKLMGLLSIEKTDQLQTEIESFLCEGGSIDEKLVYEETISDFIAGSETTIGFMSMVCYVLACNKDAQKKLREYLIVNKHLSVADKLKNKSYLSNVFNETLRQHPSAPVTTRWIQKEMTVTSDDEELTIDPKYMPWMSGYMVQKDPLLWDQPEKFIPERWLTEQLPGSHFPFGVGARRCLGMDFARREAAVVLSGLIENYEVSLADPNYKLKLNGNLTLRAVEPVMVRFDFVN